MRGRTRTSDFPAAAEDIRSRRTDGRATARRRDRGSALEAAGERPARSFRATPCSAVIRQPQAEVGAASPHGERKRRARAWPHPAGPAPRVPHRMLTLALRLAATFGSAAAFEALLRPGALTVIGEIEPDRLNDFCRVLSDAALPPDWAAVREPVAHAGRPRRHRADPRAAGQRRQGHALRHARHDAPHPRGAGDRRPRLRAAAARPRSRPRARAGTARPGPAEPAHRRDPGRAPAPQPCRGGRDRRRRAACRPAVRCRAGRSADPAAAARPARTHGRAGRGAAGRDLRARTCSRTPPPAFRLADLAGLGPAKDLALHLVADLRAWARGELPWADVSRGLLLAGPPGTGKTELARAMAREAGLHLESGSFAEWQAAGHLGDMLAAMRKSFASAVSKAPAVMFIDEIDAFGTPHRGPLELRTAATKPRSSRRCCSTSTGSPPARAWPSSRPATIPTRSTPPSPARAASIT